VANFGERYELIRRIGSGGMGEVWLAHDEQLANRPVAIKIMHKHMLPNANDVARFERETRFAAMMDHPNIVTVYTTGTNDGAPFMVMEYLRGHDLEQEPGKALPGGGAERVAGIGRDVCSGLAYAHREGVIHRDIKPGNLFLCDTGRVKITDFGVAKAAGGMALSTADTLPGTVAYIAPERWLGEPPTFSNDIWAAGCVLYRLISGRLPRVLPDAAGYAAAAVRGEPVPDLHDITEAPAWLTATVMAMLAAGPADRPTAGDCVHLLSAEQVPVPAPGRRARRRPSPGQPGQRPPEPGSFTGAATEEPAAASVTQPAAARRAARRLRRVDRVIIAIGGVALLLLGGSIAAWRLSAAPTTSALSLRGTTASPPPGQAADGGVPATSTHATRPGSAAAAPSVAPSAAPSVARAPASPYPLVSQAASRSASPASSRSAPPASTPAASPTVSGPASSTPATVPVPDVVGMTFTAARLLLQSDGFTVVGKHVRLGQIVTRTIPAARARAGGVVIVVYGTGA
jgi:serine/threonine-protein kinase